jgi:NifU-like protein involved in Fe-S cluster formation
MKYSELTLRYFESAPRAGALMAEGLGVAGMGTHGGGSRGAGTRGVGAPRVFRGSAGHRDRGTWVQFDLEVVAGRCVDARFLVFGCPHTIAVAAWVAEQGIGTLLGADLPEPVAALAQRFEVPAEKMGRLLIVEDAWRAASAIACVPS